MKTITTLLTTLALCTATIAWADDIVIPTDDEHPFDLTQGTLEGNGMSINSANEIVNGRNGHKVTFTLQNIENVDYYMLTFKAGTTRNDARFHITITAQDGSVACDETVALTNNGAWTANVPYAVKTGQMKTGRYTLVFDFITEGNNYVARLADIAIKKPLKLNPGDEVTIANPEFDAELTGWTCKNTRGGVKNMFGNRCAELWLNSGTMSISQDVVGLPDGIYLMLASAYDDARSWNGTDTLQTYLFLNDTYQPMKNAYDDAVGYRNIYRIYDGQSNNNSYRMTADARYVPKAGHEWNECLAMAEGLYVNGVAATVTGGKATFGWMKMDANRQADIVCDHFRLVYLSDDITLDAKARTALVGEYVTAAYKARLDARRSTINALLNDGRSRAPQAVAEARNLIAMDGNAKTRNEMIDAILHAGHILQRLQLPFHDITLSTPSTLNDQLSARGIGAKDTIALKLSGTLDEADLTALKTLKNLKELDLSETTLTALPKNQFNNNMSQLTWVTLPRQLETIGERAFYDCSSLRDMAFPATLTSIGSYAFRHCYSLDHPVIPDNVAMESSVYTGAGIRSLSLPPSLKVVPSNFCYECPDLIDIRFNGQTEIGSSAFSRCNALRKVTLTEGIEKLNNGAFAECKELASVTLPSTLIYQYSPFNKCSKLKDVTIMAACPPYGGLFDLAPDQGHSDQMEGVTVRVPRFSADAYQESIFAWKDGIIEPFDNLPPSLTMNGAFTLNVPNNLPATYKPDVDLRMMVGYPNAGAQEVTILYTKASLTVNGTSMLSTGHYKQLYSPYATRSSRYHNSEWRAPLYTSLVNNGQMRADEVTIDLQLYKNRWDFITFPFDVRVGDISCLNGSMPLIIYGYDAKKRAEGTGSAWVQMTADSTLHAGKGYIWQTGIPMNEQRDYPYNTFYVNALQNANKPNFFRNDDVEVTLEKHNAEFAQNRSWNFIGNPYPCFFDIRAIDTTAPITVWEFNKWTTGNYQAVSPLDDDYILYPGQAFFIQCPLDHDRLVFHKEGRQHDLELQFQASSNQARAAAAAQPRQVFNLLLSNDSENLETLDRTRFVINEAASLDYELGRDANKFFSLDAAAPQFYIVRDGVCYAIDERPFADGIVRLGMKTATAGTYTISLQGAQLPALGEQGVILIDHETGTETDLTTGYYTFTSAAGTFDSRFTIRLGAATSVSSVSYAATLLQQEAPLYDLQGRRVSSPQPGVYVKNNKKVIIK